MRVDIYGGRSAREMPLYAVSDAARILNLPSATARAWSLGRRYPTESGEKTWMPLIEIADKASKRLSFANLVELHVLSVLRGKQVRCEKIRTARKFISQQMKTSHPLADVDTHTDCVDVYVEYMGMLLNASLSQRVLREAVESRLERIERNQEGLAARLFPITTRSDSRAIVIDPQRRFGRAVLASCDIETDAIASRFRAGDSVRELAKDLGVTETDVEEALRFADLAA